MERPDVELARLLGYRTPAEMARAEQAAASVIGTLETVLGAQDATAAAFESLRDRLGELRDRVTRRRNPEGFIGVPLDDAIDELAEGIALLEELRGVIVEHGRALADEARAGERRRGAA